MTNVTVFHISVDLNIIFHSESGFKDSKIWGKNIKFYRVLMN